MSNLLMIPLTIRSPARSARLLALLFIALLVSATAWAQYKVVFQVSDGDPAKWNLTLNNVRNVQQELGADKVQVEIVAYGPGISMLKLESPVSGRVAEALKQRVKVVACENTMTAQKLVRADMAPDIGYVPAGVVELVKLQGEGWAYIRP